MPITLNGDTGIVSPAIDVTTPIAVTDGGTGVTTSTGSGAVVLNTSATISSPTFTGTPTGVGVLTSGTAVTATSGTSIDFTGIPSWVKRITVMFDGVSSNGTSNFLIQLGDSGGVETTGYVSQAAIQSNVLIASTAGFILEGTANAAAGNHHGLIIISSLSGNIWVGGGTMHTTNPAFVNSCAGSKTLSATLDRIRITTVNGTDTFDAGSINILFE